VKNLLHRWHSLSGQDESPALYARIQDLGSRSHKLVILWRSAFEKDSAKTPARRDAHEAKRKGQSSKLRQERVTKVHGPSETNN